MKLLKELENARGEVKHLLRELKVANVLLRKFVKESAFHDKEVDDSVIDQYIHDLGWFVKHEMGDPDRLLSGLFRQEKK